MLQEVYRISQNHFDKTIRFVSVLSKKYGFFRKSDMMCSKIKVCMKYITKTRR